MDTIRVLIADDHALFRDGMRALIGSIPDMEIVGEASTGSEAVAQAATLEPDVILMDVSMPEMDGITATRKILVDQPSIGIVVVTMAKDDESVFNALKAGARGYIQKHTGQAELLAAIRAVANGQSLFGSAVAHRIANFFSAPLPAPLFPNLTERERQVLQLLAQGMDTAEIARQLQIKSKTVSNITSSILTKLQVADRTQAILKAREAGLG